MLICLVLGGCTNRILNQEPEDILASRNTLSDNLEVSVTRSREEVKELEKKPELDVKQVKKRAPMKKSQIKSMQVVDKNLAVYAPCDCSLNYEKSSDGVYTVNLNGNEFKGQILGVDNINENLRKAKRGSRIGTATAHLKIELEKITPNLNEAPKT